MTELPPTDASWAHVTINDLTRRQFEARGFQATTIYNAFDTEAAPGNRAAMRAELGVADHELLVAHPVRAIPRKNVPVALRVAEQLGGTYWLLGQAEDGYGRELDWLLASARCRVIQRRSLHTSDIYAAADVVVFPSLWEGFGNPPVEAAIHGRPVLVGNYPVADELVALGFDWFRPGDVERLAAEIDSPDLDRLRHNRDVARQWFSFDRIRRQLADLLTERGWLP